MKQFSLFLVAIFLLTAGEPVFGQNTATPTTRHELRMGSGFLAIPSFWGGQVYVLEPITSRNFYMGDETFSPSVFLTYTYRFKTWISFGAAFTYSGSYQNSYNLYNNAIKTKNREHYVSITPTVRFDWSRGGLVTLYSSVGIGVGVNIEKHKIVSSGMRYGHSNVFATIDVVPIGISIGRKLFGFCELGIGANGIARAGVGYRFNSKNSR